MMTQNDLERTIEALLANDLSDEANCDVLLDALVDAGLTRADEIGWKNGQEEANQCDDLIYLDDSNGGADFDSSLINFVSEKELFRLMTGRDPHEDEDGEEETTDDLVGRDAWFRLYNQAACNAWNEVMATKEAEES